MTDAATIARAAALNCEAKKDGLRQTQDGLWRVTFTVSPLDMPQSLMAARPGTRYMLALVEIGDDEQPVTSGPLAADPMAAPTQPPEETPKAPEKQRTTGAASQDAVVKRCAMLCDDAQFQRWLRDEKLAHWPPHSEPAREWTAAAVRSLCGVTSRRDLALNIRARNAWLALEDEYMQATGRRTWRRPNERKAS